MNKTQIIIRILVVIGIVIFVNLISNQLHLRLDFTEDNRYTLSDATKDVLKELDDVITIKAYFSEELPPQLQTTKRDFEDFLVEYESRSGGNVVFEFVNPNEGEQGETEAQQNGISPLIIGVNENDKVVQMRAYMGATLQLGDKKEVIPQIQQGASMEYDLTTAIKKLSVEDKPKIGLITGHGEPTLQQVAQLAQQLLVLYDVQPLELSSVPSIGQEFRSLVWINPLDTIPQGEFIKIDNYLNGGGKLLLAYNTVTGDMSQGMLQKKPGIGIKHWLAQKGVELGDQFVVDAQCSQVQVRQQRGFMTMLSNVQFPYFPIITNFANHPVAGGIEQIAIPFANNINFIGSDSTVKFIPLLKTSEKSGFVSGPNYIDIEKKWSEADFTVGSQVIGAAFENVEGPGSSLVVISNGEFIINGDQQQPVQEDNINLISNGIDWLSDDTGLIDLRTQRVTSRPLKPVEDGVRQTYKIANAVVPLLLVLVYGFIRRQRNNKKRQAWMQGNV